MTNEKIPWKASIRIPSMKSYEDRIVNLEIAVEGFKDNNTECLGIVDEVEALKIEITNLEITLHSLYDWIKEIDGLVPTFEATKLLKLIR